MIASTAWAAPAGARDGLNRPLEIVACDLAQHPPRRHGDWLGPCWCHKVWPSQYTVPSLREAVTPVIFEPAP